MKPHPVKSHCVMLRLHDLNASICMHMASLILSCYGYVTRYALEGCGGLFRRNRKTGAKPGLARLRIVVQATPLSGQELPRTPRLPGKGISDRHGAVWTAVRF